MRVGHSDVEEVESICRSLVPLTPVEVPQLYFLFELVNLVESLLALRLSCISKGSDLPEAFLPVSKARRGH
jgi:hypothetical protein